MGLCLSSNIQKQKKHQSSFRPIHEPLVYNMRIQQILNEYDIEELKNKWNPEQLKIVSSRLKMTNIQQVSFYQLFPNFKSKKNPYSKKTLTNLFKIFVNKTKINCLSKQEFLDKLTILLNVQDFQVLSDLLFYTYLYDQNYQRQNEQKRKQRQRKAKKKTETLQIHTEQKANMHSQKQNQISKDQNLNSQTPTPKPEEQASQPNLYKSELTKKDIQLFIEQNSQFLRQPIQNKTLNEQIERQNTKIGKDQFTFLVSYYYDLERIKQLFLFNLQGLQSDFISQLLEKKFISYQEKQLVCIISRFWLDQWIKYVNIKYGAKITYTFKRFEIEQINNWKKQDLQQNKLQTKKPAPINNECLEDMEKNGLRKDIIQGRHYYILPKQYFYKLKILYSGGPTFIRVYPNIHTFKIIKTSVDQKAQFKPNSSEIFNQTDLQKPITSLINQKKLDQMELSRYVCYFRHPGQIMWRVLKDIKKNLASFFNSIPSQSELNKHNLDLSLNLYATETVNYNKTYVCFVRRESQSAFQKNYNPFENNGKIKIKNRIKNYGAILKMSHNGEPKTCQVTKIVKDEKDTVKIIVQFRDDFGNLISFYKSIQSLQRENSQQLFLNSFASDFKSKTQISGLTNLGNSCYINSVIQCLFKTPYFNQYIKKFQENHEVYEKEKNFKSMMEIKNSKVKTQRERQRQLPQKPNPQNMMIQIQIPNKQKQELSKTLNTQNDKDKTKLLFYGLFQLYKEIQKQKAVVDTKNFKQYIDLHFPHFQGFQQQDAQQFLNQLLNKISDQVKQSKKRYLGLNQWQKSVNSQDNYNQSQDKNIINKKIMKFFSGKIQIQTICLKCNNKKSRTQSFFSYSLALPEHRQRQIYLTVILKKDNIPKKMGFTVEKHTKIQDLLRDLSKKVKIQTENLILVSLFNGQWMQVYDRGMINRDATELCSATFGAICYQVDNPNQINYSDLKYLYGSNLKGKSLKIQVRQRFYDGKNKRFQHFLIPFLVQIKQQTSWGDVQNFVREKISIWNEEPKPVKAEKLNPDISSQDQIILIGQPTNNSNINLLRTQKRLDSVYLAKSAINAYLKESVKQQQVVQEQHQGQAKKYRYKIRPITKYANFEDKCFFCRNPFRTKSFIDQQQKEQPQQKTDTFLNRIKSSFLHKQTIRFCKQDSKCSFNPEKPLIDQFQFRNKYDTIFIAADWDHNYAVRNPDYQLDQSFNTAKDKQKNRKDYLDDIMLKNSKIQQRLQLQCQNPMCNGKDGLRIQQIDTFPNILILHLKRFRYEGGSIKKLNNNVIFDQSLTIQGIGYDLYGIVCHTGSGSSGHYYSYILNGKKWYKCNDQLVQIVKTEKQFIDPNTYILFYKKRDFQASLVCLKF